MERIYAHNFHDYLNGDYAEALTEGVSNIDETSAIVTRLVEWSRERGYELSREDAVATLTAYCEWHTHRDE